MRPARFVDANIFIYTISGVDKIKQSQCVNLFEKAVHGEVHLWTTEWVMAELVWFFHKQRWGWKDIKRTIDSILTMKGVSVRHKGWVGRVIERCVKATDFVDIVNIDLAKEEGIRKGYSFDKGLDKWKGFKRLEP